MTVTKNLMGVLEGEAPRKVKTSLLIKYATRNKVLLHLLRSLGIENSLRERQEKLLIGILKSLADIALKVQETDYAVIKFFKPLAYVPSDIDLLVKKDHLNLLLGRLKALGYRLLVYEPNCITVEGETIVDIYINPDFMNVPYISGEKLLRFAQVCEVNGVEVKKLKPEAEAVLALSHAVYKEQILTLNDYYTARSYLDSASVKIAEELMVVDALAYSLRLLEEVDLGKTETPIRIPARDATKLLILKFVEDSLSKRYLPHMCSKFLDRRTPLLLKSRLFRQTY